MKVVIKCFIFLIVLGITLNLNAQAVEGSVSFISSNQVYVKFQSTKEIQMGDTLFAKTVGDKLIGALIVGNKSSISCVCTRTGLSAIQNGDKVYYLPKSGLILPAFDDTLQDVAVLPDTLKSTTVGVDTAKPEVKKASTKLRGRLSLASSTTANSQNPTVSQRMRYTLAFNVDKINGTALSAETYITFSHRDNRWAEIKEDIFNGLKIYSFALNYRFNPVHQLSFGRKINPNIAQLGVNDGLQYEFNHRNITLGLIAGSRPDQQNFSLNTGLVQAGAYFSHGMKKKKGAMQSSAAFVEQTNKGLTDRRFIYFQHSNSLLKDLYFFGSLEFDLFKKVNDISLNQFNLSNSFLSIRYKPVQKLSMSLSYSSRQAIIYYETYKTIVEQLLEQASTQGLNFQTDFRPFKGWTLGFRAGYRNNAKDARETKNLHTYLHLARVPWLNVAASLSATIIATPYMDGNVYSLSCYKDFLQGRLNTNIGYRYVDYFYLSGEFTQQQHMTEIGVGYRLTGKLFLNLNTEQSFEKTLSTHRVYLSVTQRF